ncbi:hypothetical protein IWQ62_004946 [Dispira parvispora]|uniref:PROP1-like PPR domain-containing protein n=1 Tax=Dispira parvispora TaxID=1520584 RepID=A0A9W8ARQ7_9FUNG|nr:hypothetical protein IWQ62_004946 [Dispira parvispora]
MTWLTHIRRPSARAFNSIRNRWPKPWSTRTLWVSTRGSHRVVASTNGSVQSFYSTGTTPVSQSDSPSYPVELGSVPNLPDHIAGAIQELVAACESRLKIEDLWNLYQVVSDAGYAPLIPSKHLEYMVHRLHLAISSLENPQAVARVTLGVRDKTDQAESLYRGQRRTLEERLVRVCQDWWGQIAEHFRLPEQPWSGPQIRVRLDDNRWKLIPREKHPLAKVEPDIINIINTLVKISRFELAWSLMRVVGDAGQPVDNMTTVRMLQKVKKHPIDGTALAVDVYHHSVRWRVGHQLAFLRQTVGILTRPQVVVQGDPDLAKILQSRTRDGFEAGLNNKIRPPTVENVQLAAALARDYLAGKLYREAGIYDLLIHGFYRIGDHAEAMAWYHRLLGDKRAKHKSNSCTAILRSLAAMKEMGAMQEFYLAMRARGLAPSLIPDRILLHTAIHNSNWKLFDFMVEELGLERGPEYINDQGPTVLPPAFVDLIRGYARMGKPDETLRWYEYLQRQGLLSELPLIEYTTVISALGSAGYPDEAWKLYQRMGEFGLEPNSVTYSCLVNLSIKKELPAMLEDITRDIEQAAQRDPLAVSLHVYVDLARGYALRHNAAQVKALRERIYNLMTTMGDRHVLSIHQWNGLIYANGQVGFLEEAWSQYRMLSKRGIKADIFTFSTMLNIAMDNPRYRDSIPQLVSDLEASGLPLNQVVYADLMESFAVRQEPKQTLSYLHRMVQDPNIHPLTVCCDRLITILGSLGETRLALALFGAMQGQPVAASEAPWVLPVTRLEQAPVALSTYNAVLDLCVTNGWFDTFAEYWERIRDAGFQPDAETYQMRIKLAFAQENPRMAIEILEDMKAHQVTPTRDVFDTLVEGFCQKGDLGQALTICGHMFQHQLKPAFTVFRMLQPLCRTTADVADVLGALVNPTTLPLLDSEDGLMQLLVQISRGGQDESLTSALKELISQHLQKASITLYDSWARKLEGV